MVELRSVSALCGCRVLAKLEHLLPSGSVKDRAALAMIDDAAAQGHTHIVEATAGNTGIALGSLARARGLRLTVCVPDNTAAQKAHEVVLCPSSAKLGEPLHFQSQARDIAARSGGLYLCQFDNLKNCEAHERTTGPEFYHQSGGHLDAVVLASGTGGTIAGVSRFLEQHKVKVYLANSQGSGVAVENHIARLKTADEPKSPSILEGIGSGRVYGNLAQAKLEGCIEVSDREAIGMMRFLLKHEGYFVGGSSGLNVCAAVKLARQLGPGKTIATILCDGGQNYLEKHWGDSVLENLKLPANCDENFDFLEKVSQ